MRAQLGGVSLLLLASCGDDSATPPTATWQLLGSQRPSALLAAWASGTDNAWVVGGREPSDMRPTVLRFDGTACPRAPRAHL